MSTDRQWFTFLASKIRVFKTTAWLQSEVHIVRGEITMWLLSIGVTMLRTRSMALLFPNWELWVSFRFMELSQAQFFSDLRDHRCESDEISWQRLWRWEASPRWSLSGCAVHWINWQAFEINLWWSLWNSTIIWTRSGWYFMNLIGFFLTCFTVLGPSFETVDWMTFFGGSFDSISYFDAKYVQLIHSNAGFYGITESRGHVDFFPNGMNFISQISQIKFLNVGGKEQGGCENNAMANSCYHSRSWQMYQESVRNPNTFLAQKCDSYEQFKKEACHNEQAFMGHSLNVSARGNFFLRTHRNVYRMSVGSSGVHYRKTKVCKDDICIYQEEFMD